MIFFFEVFNRDSNLTSTARRGGVQKKASRRPQIQIGKHIILMILLDLMRFYEILPNFVHLLLYSSTLVRSLGLQQNTRKKNRHTKKHSLSDNVKCFSIFFLWILFSIKHYNFLQPLFLSFADIEHTCKICCFRFNYSWKVTLLINKQCPKTRHCANPTIPAPVN